MLAEFRAGSGITTDECATGRGWLPNGTYTVGQHYETYNEKMFRLLERNGWPRTLRVVG
ncbi:hypothetical protein [Streptomyces sp. NPDC097981]|uniref:hypothetical protein n=1 Tax=Streptomyces sp. NPDC097981 TaxID=3155428 RepID=UPI00332364A0